VSAAVAVERSVEARPTGHWQLARRRFLRDRVAVASSVFVLVLLLACFAGGPILTRVLGHGPNDPFPYATNSLRPVGPFTRVPDINTILGGDTLTPAVPKGAPTTLLALGADGPLGRDELLRLLYGGQVSLGRRVPGSGRCSEGTRRDASRRRRVSSGTGRGRDDRGIRGPG
jgi:ABC-type dipeptide/oligopeptide/nickel transport system permease subunit